MLPYFLLLSLLSFMPVSTIQNKGAFRLESTHLLDYLPSGSAMAVLPGAVFIAGDDSPYLFELDPHYELRTKHLLLEKFAAEERITKAHKPDFESMAEEEVAEGSILYLFGSGSKSPERDQLLLFSVAAPEQLQEFSLTPFYSQLAQLNGGSREWLNLEGAFINGEKLYLLNRAGNQLITLSLREFKEHLAGKRSSAELHKDLISLQLPAQGKIQVGFSGACTIPGTSKVIFTATLEDTDNWIDDGEILGSYMGILDLEQLPNEKPQFVERIKKTKEKPFTDKLESVAFNGFYKNGDVKLVAVADNDDGTTLLFEFRLLKEFL